MENEWIDCKTTLPDEDICVLIALSDEEVWTGFIAEQEWHYVSGDTMQSKVTHWMHLPEPPQRAT